MSPLALIQIFLINMKKRLFIAFTIPEDIKKDLLSCQEDKKIKRFNLRWQRLKNLHITLLFLGWQDEKKINDILFAIQKSFLEFKPSLIEIVSISLGPKKENQRLVWAQGKQNLELENLRKMLIKNLKEQNVFFQEEKRPFQIHITLARAKGRELLGIDFQKEVFFTFLPKELVLFESILKKEGVEYRIIKTFNLKI